MRKQIGVIGPSKSNLPEDKTLAEKIMKTAERLGELLAENDTVVFTGGSDGVMEAVARGAKRKGGITVGTPGRKRGSANKFIDIEILTPAGIGDFIFAGIPSCDAIIVIPGGSGTLSETCIAYRNKKPIIIVEGFDEWYDKLVDAYMDNGRLIRICGTKTPEDAVKMALELSG